MQQGIEPTIGLAQSSPIVRSIEPLADRAKFSLTTLLRVRHLGLAARIHSESLSLALQR